MIRIFVLLLLAGLSCNAATHEMRPAVSTLTADDNGILVVELEFNLEAWLVGVDPLISDIEESPLSDEYDVLRRLSPEALVDHSRKWWRELAATLVIETETESVEMVVTQIEIEDPIDIELPRTAIVNLVGGLPDGTSSFIYAVSQSHPNTAIRFMREGKPHDVQFVKTGEVSTQFVLEQNVTRLLTQVVTQYVGLGFTHIIPKGLDHIVFILGLVLISRRTMDLVVQVTAFTVAHSVTLALGLYGLVTVPPSVVEPLIAASIVYIAVENIWRQSLHRSRTLIIFVFGLLHGLGFAGVLMELGLPARDFIIGLLSFNLGVELGQFAIIIAAYLSVGIWTCKSSWYRRGIVIPSSVGIGLVGLYWFIERVFW